MAYCNGTGKSPGITLDTWAKPCPWQTASQRCLHSTIVTNKRRTAIYKIEIMSRPKHKVLQIDGRPYVIRRHKMISSHHSCPQENFDLTRNPSSDPDLGPIQTEQMITVASYYPASHWPTYEEEGTESGGDQLGDDKAMTQATSVPSQYEIDVP
jgi:hypothetical protein